MIGKVLQTGKKKSVIIKYCIFIVLILAVILYVKNSIQDILREVKKTSAEELAVMLGLSFLYFGIEGRVISVLAKKYCPSFSLTRGMRCAYFCNFYRIVTFGSGTGIAEIYYLNRSGVDGVRATGMSLVQYIIQKITTAIYGIAGYFVFYHMMKELTGEYEGILEVGFFVSLVIVGALVLISTSSAFSCSVFWGMKRVCRGKEKWMDRIGTWEGQIEILQREAKELLKDRKKLLRLFGYDFVKMTLWYLIPYVVMRGYEGLPPVFAAALMAVVFTLAGVLPAPSGFGSLELVFVLLYGKITGNAKAVSAILLFRFVTNIIPFVIGAVENFRFQRVCGSKQRSENITV